MSTREELEEEASRESAHRAWLNKGRLDPRDESHNAFVQVVSGCCGASPKNFNNDCDSTDIGICPACGEHCEFVPEEEE